MQAARNIAITPERRALAPRAAPIAVRLCALLFILAGLEKAADPAELSRVFEFYRFPRPLASISVWAVTLGEVTLGTLLLLQPLSRTLLYVLVGTLFLFSANLCVLLFSERAPSCACGSLILKYQDGRNGKILGLVRNSILLLAAGWALYVARRGSATVSVETATT